MAVSIKKKNSIKSKTKSRKHFNKSRKNVKRTIKMRGGAGRRYNRTGKLISGTPSIRHRPSIRHGPTSTPAQSRTPSTPTSTPTSTPAPARTPSTPSTTTPSTPRASDMPSQPYPDLNIRELANKFGQAKIIDYNKKPHYNLVHTSPHEKIHPGNPSYENINSPPPKYSPREEPSPSYRFFPSKPQNKTSKNNPPSYYDPNEDYLSISAALY